VVAYPLLTRNSSCGLPPNDQMSCGPDDQRMLWKALKPYVLALFVIALISGLALWLAGPQTTVILSMASERV